MNCREARLSLLEVDTHELPGSGVSPLAAHLRVCAPCRAAADAVRRAERSLASELDRLASFGDPARSAPNPWDAAPRPVRRAPWKRVALIPLAVAATLTVALLVRDTPPPSTSPLPAPGAVRPLSPFLELEVRSPVRSAALFRTGDPDIVVVWFF